MTVCAQLHVEVHLTIPFLNILDVQSCARMCTCTRVHACAEDV